LTFFYKLVLTQAMKAKRKRPKPPRYKCVIKYIKDYEWCTFKTYSSCIINLQRKKFPEAVWRNLKKYADLNFNETQTLDNIFFWGSCVTRCNHRVHWEITDRGKMGKEAASTLGKIGGKSGTGKNKIRGDSNYYKLLAKLSVAARQKKKLAMVNEINHFSEIRNINN